MFKPVSSIKEEVTELLKSCEYTDLGSRLSFYSTCFLQKRYVDDPLSDQAPNLYRLDGFDCVTLVETVLAFCFSENIDQFESWMDKIRYKNGCVSLFYRNHFMTADWIPNLVGLGKAREVTNQVAADLGAKLLEAKCTKQRFSFFLKAHAEKLKENGIEDLPQLDAYCEKIAREYQQVKLLAEEEGKTPYIEIEDLLQQKDNWVSFPSNLIVCVVRPNWDLTQDIGTHLNISHLGFLVWKEGTLYLRHASQTHKQVCDEPLEAYLLKYQDKDKTTVRGLNFLQLQL